VGRREPTGKGGKSKKKKKPMRWSQREARREGLNEDKPMRRAGESSPGKAETKLGGGAEKARRAEREQVLSYVILIYLFFLFFSFCSTRDFTALSYIPSD